jgi:outer membrane murein-binding lipoprotein Lpp|tara:strand:+ start:1261 stop:1425 length:165 start_codon:yes stop_codon:yes gene_type:complete
MDFISNIVMWVTAIVTCSSIIAACTNTPKDDEFISNFYKLIDLLALNVLKAKDK